VTSAIYYATRRSVSLEKIPLQKIHEIEKIRYDLPGRSAYDGWVGRVYAQQERRLRLCLCFAYLRVTLSRFLNAGEIAKPNVRNG
jgi:hypothetical protein